MDTKIVNKVNDIVEDENYEQSVIERIAECNLVVNDLQHSSAWIIIQRDLLELKAKIDESWQEITDSAKLERARVMKFAIQHLIDIKRGYEDELKAATEILAKLQHPDEVIMKDYSNEEVN